MLKQYETVFIMTPVLSDDQMKETVNKFQKFLKEKGAEIVFEDNWGLRKLAYPIQKKSTGFFHLFEYKGEGNIVSEFEVALKRDERVMRYLSIVLDKHSLAYNEKKRNAKNASAKKATEQEVEN